MIKPFVIIIIVISQKKLSNSHNNSVRNSVLEKNFRGKNVFTGNYRIRVNYFSNWIKLIFFFFFLRRYYIGTRKSLKLVVNQLSFIFFLYPINQAYLYDTHIIHDNNNRQTALYRYDRIGYIQLIYIYIYTDRHNNYLNRYKWIYG